MLHAKSYAVAKRTPVGVAWKLGEGVPAQVSSSSSDRGLKLRGPFQNGPRVSSKRDVNIPKTKLFVAFLLMPMFRLLHRKIHTVNTSTANFKNKVVSLKCY
ncbi:hypothetical protein AVEN_80564-1 [Araneus ventricosus]|uniref:Uncharacterized protein n=1 Tax=Araneus ventricosus TaxID=182803 RepID=A0A4Y2CNP0_ARAVE|nr:hypothetical protein AVEN_80564-1 [Araneus ventricosus]